MPTYTEIANDWGLWKECVDPGANMTQQQFDRGLTFLHIMEQNLKNLRKGLECEG